MANCKLAQNILKSDFCGYSLLKVTDIYLGNYSDVTASVSGNEVTSITLANSANMYHVEPSKDSASFTDELQVTDLGRYVAVAKLANGVYVMLGRVTPLEATSANVSGAASASDSTAIQVVMTSDTTETVLPLSSAAITALLAAVAE